MKTTLTISLAFLFLLQTFTRTFIIVNYQVNKNYISNVLCENKEKTAMHCEGKCHLKKELEKEEKKESTPSGSKEKIEIILYSEKTTTVSFVASEPVKSSFIYSEIYPQDFTRKIFHPPTIIG